MPSQPFIDAWIRVLGHFHTRLVPQVPKTGLPQIQDFEIPDFFKTFSGPEIVFFKTANDRNFIRANPKI